MFRMLRAFSLPLALAATLATAATALAAAFEFNIYSPGVIASPTQVYVGTSITCDPNVSQASLSLKVVQPSGTGVGSSPPITCDGTTHYYAIPVTATSGTFQRGPAQVSDAGSYRTCQSTPTGRQCVGNEWLYEPYGTIQLAGRHANP